MEEKGSGEELGEGPERKAGKERNRVSFGENRKGCKKNRRCNRRQGALTLFLNPSPPHLAQDLV